MEKLITDWAVYSFNKEGENSEALYESMHKSERNALREYNERISEATKEDLPYICVEVVKRTCKIEYAKCFKSEPYAETRQVARRTILRNGLKVYQFVNPEL